MKENFDHAFALVIAHEGGYVDDPRDPGQATNLGVTIGTLSAWLGRQASKAEVRALTPDAVRPIYKKNYWDKIRGDELPAGVDFAVYDFAVNSGPSRGAMALQRAIGVADDGVVGSITLANIASRPVDQIIERITADRMTFLRRLSTWPRFGKGWTTRVNEVNKQAMDMAHLASVPVGKVDVKPIPVIPAAPVAAKPSLFKRIAALFSKAA
jgi:lysozyme family protein